LGGDSHTGAAASQAHKFFPFDPPPGNRRKSRAFGWMNVGISQFEENLIDPIHRKLARRMPILSGGGFFLEP
jgi:hypothetical protein